MMVAVRRLGVSFDLGRGSEAVQLRHLGVQEHQREWLSRLRCARRNSASAAQPLATRVGFIPHCSQRHLQDAPVGGIIIHDQHRNADEAAVRVSAPDVRAQATPDRTWP